MNCRLSRLTVQPGPFSFLLKETTGRTVSVQFADVTPNWNCSSCEIAVSGAGIGAASNRGEPAITFKLSEDGAQLLLTCRAMSCEILTARTMEVESGIFRASGDLARRRLTTDEATRVSASQRALLTIIPK